MAGDRGRIPYLGSHGYFVSTSSDEEDNFDRSHEYYSYEKYWRGDKERSLQGAADEVCDDKNLPQIERSGWNQSIAYPALAPKVQSVQRSVELFPSTKSRAHGKKHLYHDPIDSELYYSHPQSFSQPEVKRLLGEVQNSHYKNTSDLFIVDLENNSEAAELYPSNTNSTVRPPLKERKGKAAMKKKYSTDDCGPILKSLELVKTFESDCLSREEHCLRTREKSFRYTDGDLVTSEGEKQRIQQTRVRITPMMKVLMHMDNFSHTDRPFAETDHETGGIGIECEQVPSSPPCTRIQKDKKDVSIVATTEMAPHNAGERKEFSTWQSSGESRETSQIEVVLGLMDNLSTNTLSSSPEVITAPKHRENAEARGMVKLGVPAYTRNKAKILTKINQSRGVREIGYQRSDDSAGSNVIDIGRKEAASPRSKHLRRRQLQTLKVVDHNTPRSDARAVTTTLNLPEGSRRAGDLKGTTCTKILTTDTIHLENSRTTRKHCNPKIDDEISSCFPEKENNAQSEVLELEEKESIEYMMAISEDQRLEMSSYPPPPQGEEKTSLLQYPSAESRVECYSQEVVQTQEPYSELDVDVQSNTLLQLLREMQNHRPGPATICDNTNAVKTGGMVDPAPQRGSYLAQYLKKQSRAGARRISMDK